MYSTIVGDISILISSSDLKVSKTFGHLLEMFETKRLISDVHLSGASLFQNVKYFMFSLEIEYCLIKARYIPPKDVRLYC